MSLSLCNPFRTRHRSPLHDVVERETPEAVHVAACTLLLVAKPSASTSTGTTYDGSFMIMPNATFQQAEQAPRSAG